MLARSPSIQPSSANSYIWVFSLLVPVLPRNFALRHIFHSFYIRFRSHPMVDWIFCFFFSPFLSFENIRCHERNVYLRLLSVSCFLNDIVDLFLILANHATFSLHQKIAINVIMKPSSSPKCLIGILIWFVV